MNMNMNIKENHLSQVCVHANGAAWANVWEVFSLRRLFQYNVWFHSLLLPLDHTLYSLPPSPSVNPSTSADLHHSSEDVCKHGFTIIIDMRGSKWESIKPFLKVLQDSFPSCIHVALIIKPDNFWEKQRTNFGSSKFEFEVRWALFIRKQWILGFLQTF